MSGQQEPLWLTLSDVVKEKVYLHDGYIMLKLIAPKYLRDIAKFTVRPDDIFLISYPKAGTTWTQHIICLILETKGLTTEQHLFEKVLFLEFPQTNGPVEHRNSVKGRYEIADVRPSPRVLKSHLRMRFLPNELRDKKPKIVYVARNPKDSAASLFNFYNFSNNTPQYKDWSEFIQDFCRGSLPRGSWFDHVLPWWNKRHEANILFLQYEDIQKDLRGSVLKIANFLEYSLSDDDVDNIVAKSTFKAMKTNPMVNPDTFNRSFQEGVRKNKSFMRRGKVGDWKNYFTIAQSEYFDNLYERMTQGTGLSFDFSLE